MITSALTKAARVGIFSLFFSMLAANLFADGFIIPQPKPGEDIPPLTVKYHRVNVKIDNQVAETSIDQVFVNNFYRDIEGVYIFPIPENASISKFAMYIGEKKVDGEILDKDRARRIYEEIVRKLKDPALLEYIGRRMFRARVYPIPANGEKRITLSYTEVLHAEGNLIRYIYPLNTEKFSLHPVTQVAISTKILSKVPLSSVYSSSHKVSVRKERAGEARVSYEESNVRPDKDFVLYYSFSPDEIGLSLLNWKGPENSYFMLLASPAFVARKEKVINKNLVFILDSSGSMSGVKIKQAKEAARFVINHLDVRDRFSIVDFDDGVNIFSQETVPASEENRKKALGFVDEIEDSGGTNINEALLQALRMVQSDKRPNYILFLTDGLPTVGETRTAEILRNISQNNVGKSRIVVFGVGHDVNTELLDRISLENRGTSVYVGETDNLETAISSYSEKISSPQLADIRVDFKGMEIQDVYPRTLPDLFKGSQLILVGRYKGEGPVDVILSGKVRDEQKRFALKSQKLRGGDSSDFLARLWATRRIGYLLEEIRLYGENEELVEEVKKLGLEYGIVTPYTSFLVTEKERLAMDAAAPEAVQAFAEKKVSGVGAVRMAKATQRLKAEEQAVQVESQKIRYRGDKTFYLQEGTWVDSSYREGDPVEEIKFNSDSYFRLISDKPGISKYLSVDQNMIVCYQGRNYKIIE